MLQVALAVPQPCSVISIDRWLSSSQDLPIMFSAISLGSESLVYA